MKIFLGSETEGRANCLLFPIRKTIDSLLDIIRKKNYGSALTDIGIFSIVMKEEMYDSGGYPERKYYSRVNGDADIRLRLNYNMFCNAKPEDRVEIYKRHILKAFVIAATKAKAADYSFEKEALINDVEQLLELQEVQEKEKKKGTIICLAGETEEKAIECFRETMQVVDPLLDEIRRRNYGSALRELGIFAIILKSETYEEVSLERRYYSSTKKCAEVKLRINYKKFVYGKLEDRVNMCKELILEAVDIVVKKIQKKDKEFMGERLLNDIQEALGENAGSGTGNSLCTMQKASHSCFD